MRQYYEQLYSNEVARISPWLGQGIFTPDFFGVLLSCTPHTEMMDLSAGLQNSNFFQQMDLFSAWAKERVERILNMKYMF